MTSSTACRSAVPGATFVIAAISAGSRRGSSSEGVRVKPSSPAGQSALPCLLSFGGLVVIESGADRLTERLGPRHPKCATAWRPFRGDDGPEPELRALLEPPVGLSRRPQAPREPDLAERSDARPHRLALGRGGDRESHGEVGTRLVDADAARDIDEHVGLPEPDAGVACEHGDDHREALRIDSGRDPAWHGEVGWGDERLDLEED